ncbi:tRNA(Ile)-lysidine synthase [Jannaschia faecimaris]|uniref:tRNA(Ile)-lysidine synthase n=1 Tax=Jannaschia faecimaris TaxID=1244108 RepID=A0A1H3L7H9_9RHOB|nr:tRNA lysidine(34) synthetase TilS [Jannaschia faecimaris]SDY60487.1 tRNA(Ile)-lysidine synthase [Jannaschia faecimaris]
MAAPDETALTAAIDRLLSGSSVRTPRSIGVAVSGGGDSTALLLAAQDWATQRDIPVLAATVDHGLREGAAAEAAWVAALCESCAIPHTTLRLTTLHDGPALQARARDARYAALAGWARAQGLSQVLLGHTADDVAETLLMRLKRGMGLDALASIPEWRQVEDVNFGRPFLGQSRTDLRADLASRGIVPLEDPSNDDTRFERVAVRKTMRALGLDPTMLARSARHLSDARTSLDTVAMEDRRELVREDRGDFVLQGNAIDSLQSDRLRRLVMLILTSITGKPPPREAEQTRLLSQLPRLQAPQTLAGCIILPDGSSDHAIRFAREWSAAAPAVPQTPGDAATVTLWDGRWAVIGPQRSGLEIGALGDAISQTPWRDVGLPRVSLMASPAVRDADGALVAAPVAGLSHGYTAHASEQFSATLRPSPSVFD